MPQWEAKKLLQRDFGLLLLPRHLLLLENCDSGLLVKGVFQYIWNEENIDIILFIYYFYYFVFI